MLDQDVCRLLRVDRRQMCGWLESMQPGQRSSESCRRRGVHRPFFVGMVAIDEVHDEKWLPQHVTCWFEPANIRHGESRGT
jgi:hypothetical protein